MSDSPISVETTETSSIQRTLRVEVDAKRVRKAFDRAYKDLGRQVRVRGFRPGKAPRSVLEKIYGGSIGEELEQQLVRETLPDALEQAGVEPVSEPQVDSSQPTRGEGFAYTAVVEVKPTIELPDLAGLPGSKPSVDVGDEDVEQELARLRERRAFFEDAEAGAPAEQGSHVTIDYLGKFDGEPFEGGTAEGATVEIGAGRMIPGFEEGIEGMSVGETKSITVTFPEQYQSEELAGREATFEIEVRQVKRRVLPELDDAFAKEFDDALEGLDALRERVRGDLVEGKERSAKEALHRSLIDALIERTEFDVPPGMIERRLDQQIQRAHEQLVKAMPHDELHQRLGEWSESWRPEAEREVREHLLLDAVAEQQSFEVSDEELQTKLEEMAREQGMDPDRLRKIYDEQGMEETLRSQLSSDKALEFLIRGAKVEEIAGS